MGIQRRWKGGASAIGLACAVLVWTGCGGGGESGGGGGGGPSREEQILATVAAAGKVVPLAPGAGTDVKTGEQTQDEGDYRVTYEQHDAIKNLENVTYLGLNDDLIWPGALVKGAHAHEFVFEPISVKRAPITLSVSLEGTGSGAPLSVKVDDPRLSTVRQGISTLVASQLASGTTVPARWNYTQEQVTNSSHVNIALGADASYGGGTIESAFDWNSTTKRTKMLAKYTQIYYTVDMDTPTTSLEFFSTQASAADVAAAMPPGSLPMYVASVGYGMMAVICIETDFTAEDMDLALKAGYEGAFTANVRFGYTAGEILDKSNITIIVYGGATKGLSDIEYNLDGFKKVIAASREYGPDTPGVPIVYKFRHVADNTLAMVSLTSQYTIVRPLQLRQRVVVHVDGFYVDRAVDATGGLDVYQMGAWTTAWQGDPLAQIAPGEVNIFWYDGPEIEMGTGYAYPVNQEKVVVFDTEHFNINDARLDLRGYMIENDVWPNPDDSADHTLILSGRQLFENGGYQTVHLEHADFSIRVEFRLMDGSLP